MLVQEKQKNDFVMLWFFFKFIYFVWKVEGQRENISHLLFTPQIITTAGDKTGLREPVTPSWVSHGVAGGPSSSALPGALAGN